jgi:hypothetical protein
MKRLFLTTAMFVLFTNFLTAQERIPLADFTKIIIEDDFRVILVPSDHNGILIPKGLSTDGSRIVDTATGTLKISWRNPVNKGKFNLLVGTASYIVYFKSLEQLKMSGSATAKTEKPIIGDKLEVQLSGSSSATLDVKYEKITSRLSGASTLSLSGFAQEHDTEAFGASNVRVRNLNTEKTEVKLYGASSAQITAQNVIGEVSGASTLTTNEGLNTDSVRRVGAASTVKAAVKGAENTLRDGDVTINIKKPKQHLPKTTFNPAYGLLDLGFGGYGQDFFQNTLPQGYENMQLKMNTSFAINMNLFRYGVRLGGRTSPFGIGTGMGIGWNIYKFLESDMVPAKFNGEFVVNSYDRGGREIDFKKSKLQSSWLKVPLYLQYKNKDFYVTAGVVGNVRLGASTKQVYTLNGKKRDKTKDDFYLNSFRADAEVRVGYKNVSLFATHSLTNMFLNNRGPELNMYSFGVSLWPN